MLQHPLLVLTDQDIALMGEVFAKVIEERGYVCHACAIMPDHVHMAVRRHKDHAEEMIQTFQEEGKAAIIAAGRRGLTHPVWGGPGWKVFQNSPEQMCRTIIYVEENPEKAGRTSQRWPFVTEYNGWVPRGWRRPT